MDETLKPFRVTFLEGDRRTEVTVDPRELPDTMGRKGSLLAIALQAGVDLEHSCGGCCSCATCHLYVREGLEEGTSTPESDEADMLESAIERNATSRLGCQCLPNGQRDLVVEVPRLGP